MRNITFLSILIFVFSCSSEKRSGYEVKNSFQRIAVNLDNTGSIKANTVFSSITPIFLETTENNVLARVEKIETYGDHIYLWDGFSNYGSNVLSVFDKRGKFSYKIKKTGHGPGEYLYPHGIYVGDEGIEFFDVGQRKMVRYDHAGNFSGEKNMNSDAISFIKFNGSYFAYDGIESADMHNPVNSGVELYNLQVYDEDFNLLKKAVPVTEDPIFVALVGDRNFEVQHDTLYFFRVLSDTVYRVEEGDILPSYVLDFSSYSIPNSFKGRSFDDGILWALRSERFAYGIQNLRITDNYIYCQFSFGGKKQHLLYNKQTQEVFYSENIVNDINLLLLGEVIGSDNESLYFITYPHELLAYYKSLKSEYKERLSQYLDGIGVPMPKINDNPIIIKAKLK